MPTYYISDDRMHGFDAESEEEAKKKAAEWFASHKPRPEDLKTVDVAE